MPLDTFTEEQIDFIKQNYPDNGGDFCAKALNIPKWRVMKKASRLKLKLTEDLYNKIQTTKWELEWKQRHEKRQKLEFDNFICNVNTPESIYFLGFLWGDGHLEKLTNRISININKEDGESLLNNFIKVLPFKVTTRKTNRYNKKCSDQMCFRINNKFIHDFLKDNDYLIKSGTSPNKILSFIPEIYQYYWWRGLIDADGCFFHNRDFYANDFSIASTFHQDWGFIEKLELAAKVKLKIDRRISKNGNSSTVKTSNISDINRIGEFIYQNYENDNIGLNRKFLNYKSIYYRPRTFDIKNKKRNKSTALFGIYKNKNILMSMIRRDGITYRFYSRDVNKCIEAYDRLILFLFKSNYALNKPELIDEYLKSNELNSPINLFKIDKVKTKIKD